MPVIALDTSLDASIAEVINVCFDSRHDLGGLLIRSVSEHPTLAEEMTICVGRNGGPPDAPLVWLPPGRAHVTALFTTDRGVLDFQINAPVNKRFRIWVGQEKRKFLRLLAPSKSVTSIGIVDVRSRQGIIVMTV